MERSFEHVDVGRGVDMSKNVGAENEREEGKAEETLRIAGCKRV